MRLLEDFLTEQEIQQIDAVFDSQSPRFDLLVATSGLNPISDFRFTDLRHLDFSGADLRGFDFTGSDLRKSVKNENTIIDQTTVLQDARIDWIEADALPIVMVMRKAEEARNSTERQDVLNRLVAEFGRTPHVIQYMVLAASKAHSIEDFIDFALFLPEVPSKSDAGKLRKSAEALLKRKLAASKRRTRREKTSVFAVESLTEKLHQNPGSLAQRIYGYLADVVNAKPQGSTLTGHANIEAADLRKAFARIGT